MTAAPRSRREQRDTRDFRCGHLQEPEPLRRHARWKLVYPCVNTAGALETLGETVADHARAGGNDHRHGRIGLAHLEAFARYRSVPRILARLFSPSASAQFRNSIRVPKWRNITNAYQDTHIPWTVILLNTVAMAVWTVGVFSALYAAYLRPELRVTSSQLSAIINGVATILMFMFIDPYLSMLTDELVEGKVGDPYFRRSIVWLTGSRIVGTVMAQFLLIPAALWIVRVAEWL